MGRFHVVYFGSNDVPVDLIKPILAEIDADMTIRRPTKDADVIEIGRDADGIIMHGSVPLTRDIISQLERVKVICRTGVGVDRMDLQAARDHGMIICNAAGCNSIEVSEQAIGLLIARENGAAIPPSCTPTAALFIAFKGAPWASSVWVTWGSRSHPARRE